MQLQEEMLGYEEALDNLHLDIVLQLLQAGADVEAVTAQVRPAAMICISAVSLSSHKRLGDMLILQHIYCMQVHTSMQYVQPSHVHICCRQCPNVQALH